MFTTFVAIILKRKIMATIDFSRFHELAEEFRGEMSLVKICEMEGVDVSIN